MGKIRGLKVKADAILDGAFTDSPESYVAYHGKVEKTKVKVGVSSLEKF